MILHANSTKSFVHYEVKQKYDLLILIAWLQRIVQQYYTLVDLLVKQTTIDKF